MSTIKVYDWDLWQELCEETGVNPYEHVDFSIGVPSHEQRTGAESVNYEFVGDYPEEEED